MDTENTTKKGLKIALILSGVILLLLFVFSSTNTPRETEIFQPEAISLDKPGRITIHDIDTLFEVSFKKLSIFAVMIVFYFQILARKVEKIFIVQWFIPLLLIPVFIYYNQFPMWVKVSVIVLFGLAIAGVTIFDINDGKYNFDLSLVMVISGIYSLIYFPDLINIATETIAIKGSWAIACSIFVLSVINEFTEAPTLALASFVLGILTPRLFPVYLFIVSISAIGFFAGAKILQDKHNGFVINASEILWDSYLTYILICSFSALAKYGNSLLITIT